MNKKLRKFYGFVVVLCVISLIVPFNVFAQDQGTSPAAQTGTEPATQAGTEAGKAATAGISGGTIAIGVVAVAVIVGTIIAISNASSSSNH
jgi:hypothetical protein